MEGEGEAKEEMEYGRILASKGSSLSSSARARRVSMRSSISSLSTSDGAAAAKTESVIPDPRFGCKKQENDVKSKTRDILIRESPDPLTALLGGQQVNGLDRPT